jgi:hypothetical protein
MSTSPSSRLAHTLRTTTIRAFSSLAEQHLDMVKVASSILARRTIFERRKQIMRKEKNVFVDGWTWDQITNEFGVTKKQPDQVFAAYDIDGYEGSALVIWKEGKKYFVVEGSHCSCYGLEDQWEPTEHAKVEIEKFLGAGYGSWHRHAEQIKAWMK